MYCNQKTLYLNKAKVVDIYNHIIGKNIKNNILDFIPIHRISQKDIIHQGVFVFLIQSSTNKIFCHKRSNAKQNYSECFSTCFTGIVLQNEDYYICGKRILEQETGLKLEINFLNSLYYDSKENKIWGHIFYVYYDGLIVNLKYNLQEITNIDLMGFQEIILRQNNGEQFMPDTMQALYLLNKRILHEQWPCQI